jgi:hypothetical protein
MGYIATPDEIVAILEGGPQSIPQALRVRAASPLDEKIKLPHYGGYEHFERVGWFDENGPGQHVRYRWIMRTEVAE